MSALTALVGATAGAALMYALDPMAGARRRAMARDQLHHTRRRVADATEAIARDARNRGHGALASLRIRFASVDVPDDVLEQRIRSTLGMLVRYPRLVQVQAENRRVTLAGAVASDEVGRLVRHVRRMHAVAGVDNQLGLRADPAELPGAQAPIPPRPPGPAITDLLRYTWSPSVRAGATAAGVGLALCGIRRAGASAIVLGAAGALLVLRALTNDPLFTRRDQPERRNTPRERSRQALWAGD
jgi:osmotically-inducible protein OsmY